MPERKKILYIITKGNFGGAQRYVFDLATNMPRDKFEAVVAFGKGDTLRDKLLESDIRTIEIKSLARNINILKDALAFFEIIKIIKKERPNIVHLNSSKAGLLGALAVRTLNVYFKLTTKNYKLKTIFTGHGWAFNEDRGIFQKIVIYILHWITILLSHKTIAVSKKTADQIIRLPFIKKKIETIHNGTEAFELASQIESRNFLAPQVHEKVWIGTISELHPNKGLDYLIESFAPLVDKYSNIALVIVGGGEEESNLKKLAEELNLGERITFAGFKANAKKYLGAFDIFTLTSRTEALPYAILESGIASLPTVASWVGGIPEIITNGESGILINPEKTSELTDALDSLIAQPELRQRLGRELNKNVTQNFSIQKMVKETAELY